MQKKFCQCGGRRARGSSTGIIQGSRTCDRARDRPCLLWRCPVRSNKMVETREPLTCKLSTSMSLPELGGGDEAREGRRVILPLLCLTAAQCMGGCGPRRIEISGRLHWWVGAAHDDTTGAGTYSRTLRKGRVAPSMGAENAFQQKFRVPGRDRARAPAEHTPRLSRDRVAR